ncbi:Flp pilus assembly complex ATPase component TadA [Vibrio diabolicus]|uniref:ATPase, T2SS/T4P/T4SS family n=1 Tax=Vibrio TaxID=662 RepID=UPI000997BC76|nr:MULTISPECIES: ATPase, T2SS/T4P/T4SS family [Vibrio]EGR1442748.1 hypothetical protein [Vibrio parahaemolyticus]EGR3502885.1 hypothetical protein [Vibrio parahaemolyticus]MCS0382523.1 Flp pilus assembly complex ATPase component TadA [Vibrio diabolicus]MDA0113987.1 ATPase, T2SS/T4P/T4SS family [Vibrio sp. 2art]OOX55943.1 hypothetical protein BJL79_20045 [Vibrio parahaemolyticus]
MNDIPLIPVSSEMTQVDIETVIWKAIECGASDILIDCNYRIRIDVNGQIREITDKQMQPNACRNILEYMLGTKKSLINNVNAATPTFFAFVTKNPNDQSQIRSFRIAAITSRSLEYGKTYKMVGRLNPKTPKDAESLGIEPELVNLVKHNRKGILMFVGGVGTGKTTTMAGIVTSVLKTPSLGKHILVFEDPPEINYEGVKIAPGNSISVHEVGSVETDSDVQSFNQGLEAALRLRPDIIVQGEIRSKESIENAFNASNTGNFLMATIHANSCETAMSRIYNMIDGENKLAVLAGFISQLSGIVAQILVRTLDGERIAVRETLYLTEEIREEMLKCKSDTEISVVVRRHLKEQELTFSQQIANLYHNSEIGPEYLLMESE